MHVPTRFPRLTLLKLTRYRRLSRSTDINRIINCIVGGIFVFAGINKAMDIQGFILAVEGYGLTDPMLTKILATSLPYIEILTGLLLIGGLWQKESLIILTGLCVIFTCVLLHAIHTDMQISCGCFSSSPNPGNLMLSVVRNLCIITVCTYSLTRKGSFNELIQTAKSN